MTVQLQTQDYLAISFDGGWNTLKAFANGRCEKLIHSVYCADEPQWETMRETQPNSLDMIKVDGVPYAFGEMAFTLGFVKSKRAARYVAGYYDAQYWRMLVPFLADTAVVQRVFAAVSYPPEDSRYAEDVRQLVLGERKIELLSGKTYIIYTEDVISYPELSGSMTNYLTTELNVDNRRIKMNEGTAIVIDIGGGTTDICKSKKKMQPELATALSRDIGAGSMENAFGQFLRNTYKDMFRSGISEELLRDAFMEKKIRTGKNKYDDLTSAINRITNAFFSQLDALVEQRGGWYAFDYIAFTGGGADLLREAILERYGKDHEVVFLGTQNKMEFSNVVGGHKLLRATIKREKWA